MNLYAKHATLINNCYPEKEGENKPRSSELSYLVFYASSRPVKLPKVGLYLEKKVERDASRGRKQNNHVTLDIIKALIQSCHRDLNLFSKYATKIIELVLETNDIELIDHACQVFVVFTEYHDGSTLGVDSDFTNGYEALLKKLAEFCTYKSSDEALQLQMRYSGHRTLQAAVGSSALQASNFKVQLKLILEPLIVTLSEAKNPADALAQSSESADIRASAIGHETLNSHTIDVFSAKTCALFFGKANGVVLKQSLDPIFLYFDNKNKWWPSKLVVSMMKLVLYSLQPQYRYLLVSKLIEQLEDKQLESEGYLEKRASLVSALKAVLNENTSLVGISVLEVLNALFTQLIQSLHDDGKSFINECSEENGLYYFIHQGLIDSIGGLASQTYYVNQLNDITSSLVSKLRVNSTDPIEGLSVKEYRRAVIQCLRCVAVNSTKKTEKENDNETPASYNRLISLDTLIPALGLLVDHSSETRVEFAEMLTCYLEETAENDFSLNPYPNHNMSQQADINLANTLHITFLNWVQLSTLGISDLLSMQKLLTAMTHRFGADETIRAVPLIFEIQSLVQNGTIENPASQRALAALTVEWLLMIAEFYRVGSLTEYAQVLKNERISEKEYSAVFLKEELEGYSLESLEPENSNGVQKFVDREIVVEMLSKDGPLRDQDDPEGFELGNKLNTKWDASNNDENSTAFRIRTSRNLSDLKARLDTSWSTSRESKTSDLGKKKHLINVENLKEVLGGQTEVSGLDVTHSICSKKTNDLFADMNTLLQSISSGSNDSSSSPLFNPPYKP
ncbi:hypothetical protein BY458DRAFT_548095 [Sporodiniella umbellata]|nr:hypothetical protein BY458DRAFT_548095 [Sporodiniella umbellata]